MASNKSERTMNIGDGTDPRCYLLTPQAGWYLLKRQYADYYDERARYDNSPGFVVAPFLDIIDVVLAIMQFEGDLPAEIDIFMSPQIDAFRSRYRDWWYSRSELPEPPFTGASTRIHLRKEIC